MPTTTLRINKLINELIICTFIFQKQYLNELIPFLLQNADIIYPKFIQPKYYWGKILPIFIGGGGTLK